MKSSIIKLQAEVIQEDIIGASHFSHDCPLTRCLTRVLGKPTRVGIHRAWIESTEDSKARIFLLPYEVSTKIQDFLRTNVMKPFQFQFEEEVIEA